MVRLCGLADEITRSRAIASAEAEFFSILLGSQQSPNGLSDNLKNILLSPSGGGEDEGEGVKCGVHPPNPYPLPQQRRGS